MSVLPPGSQVFKIFLFFIHLTQFVPKQLLYFWDWFRGSWAKLILICSKYLSLNVNDKAKGRSLHGLQGWVDPGSGSFLCLGGCVCVRSPQTEKQG